MFQRLENATLLCDDQVHIKLPGMIVLPLLQLLWQVKLLVQVYYVQLHEVVPLLLV